MAFDVRYQTFAFKHTLSPKPDLSEARFREHYHTTYELLFFVEGDADYALEHKRYKVQPGSLLIAKPGEYHNIVFNSQKPYERYVMRFSPLAIYPYIRQQLEKTDSVYHIEGTPIADEFRLMDKHIDYVHEDMRVNVCMGSMNIIISYLISSQDLIQKADYVNPDLRRIVKYIDANLAEIQSVDDITDALHMSKSAVYKLFSQQFDTPIMSYIRTQKCMVARNLMGEGASATEVAERLGFSHYSSFYRDYSHVFGCPPSAAINKDIYASLAPRN